MATLGWPFSSSRFSSTSHQKNKDAETVAASRDDLNFSSSSGSLKTRKRKEGGEFRQRRGRSRSQTQQQCNQQHDNTTAKALFRFLQRSQTQTQPHSQTQPQKQTDTVAEEKLEQKRDTQVLQLQKETNLDTKKNPDPSTSNSGVSTITRCCGDPMSDKDGQHVSEECAHEDFVKEYLLIRFEECPAYLCDNPYIRTGYRARFPFALCLRSFLRIHNETGNVWSHFIGFLMFAYLLVWTFYNVLDPSFLTNHNIDPANAHLYDDVSMTLTVFSIFCLSGMFSMGASTVFHLFLCHSQKTSVRCLQFDLCGIGGLIAGCFYPPVYYVFHSCHINQQYFFLGFITLFSATAILGPLWPPFNTPRFRTLRIGLYSGMALFCIWPCIQGFVNFEAQAALSVIGPTWISMACYGIGLFCYASKFPEKKWPGKFDIWMHSHTWWHLFCLLGTYLHFNTSWIAYTNRHVFANCLP